MSDANYNNRDNRCYQYNTVLSTLNNQCNHNQNLVLVVWCLSGARSSQADGGGAVDAHSITNTYSAWQRQTAVTAHFTSEQLPLFAFARRFCFGSITGNWTVDKSDCQVGGCSWREESVSQQPMSPVRSTHISAIWLVDFGISTNHLIKIISLWLTCL